MVISLGEIVIMKIQSNTKALLISGLLQVGLLAGCGGDPTSNEELGTARLDQPVAMAGRGLFISAHPDDDLLFMNPDIEGAILAGDETRTVYVTSGDAGGWWPGREEGIRAAQAAMAGVASNWSCVPRTYASKTVEFCTLVQRPSVTTVFLRLLDNQMHWLYFNPASAAQPTVDGTSSYTGAQLVSVLSAIMSEFGAQNVGMHDGTLVYGPDHNDHLASGVFALRAAQNYGQALRLRMYRGYNVYVPWDSVPLSEAPNMTQAEHDEKVRLMNEYGDGVPEGGLYDGWCWRQYYVSSVAFSGQSLAATTTGACLDTAGGAAQSGTAVVATTCDGSPGQMWSTQVDGTIRGISGQCLTAASDGNSIQISTCTPGNLRQRWALFDNGQLRGFNDTCLTQGPDGESVATIDCEGIEVDQRYAVATNQRWAPIGAPTPPPPPTPVAPSVTAPTAVTAGTAGLTVSVTARAGMSYNWTVANATITSDGGSSGVTNGTTNSITLTAGNVGSIDIACVESDGTTTSSPGSATITVAQAPLTPTVSASSPVEAGATGRVASVAARSGMTYTWTITGGTITSPGGSAGVTASGSNTITYTAGTSSPIGLSCVETNSAGTTSAAGTATVVVNEPPPIPVTPSVSAPTTVTLGTSGITATVTARAAMTYTWSVTNATITSAGGAAGVTSGAQNSITLMPLGVGIVTISCVETYGTTSSSAGSATVTVVDAPVSPAVTTVSEVEPGTAALTASVAARAAMTYSWSVSGATITSPGGTAGVTSGGINTITFTAGFSGSIALSCVETNSAGVASAPGSANITINAPPAGSGLLSISAHPDDDLLFMNPDIEAAILAGRATRTVYVTSGDAGGWWPGREEGVQAAHAAMAGVASNWGCVSRTYATKTAQLCTLNSRPTVSLVFLRLLDNQMHWLYLDPSSGAQQTVDGASTYTGTELVSVLTAIMSEFGPQQIGMHDGTLAYGPDHNDHVASAVFSLLAAQAYGQAQELRMYRGYNIYQPWDPVPAPEPRNLTQAQHDEKLRIMETYGEGVAPGGQYDEWCWRRYFISSTAVTSAPLVASNGQCLDVAGGSSASGTAAVLATCSSSASQLWSTQTDGTLRGIAGQCLTVAANGTSVQIASCSGAANQRWTLFGNGQLRGANAVCLTRSSSSTVTVGECASEEVSQRYTVAATQRWL